MTAAADPPKGKFRAPVLSGGRMVPSALPNLCLMMYPVSVTPPEGTMAGISNGDRRGGAVWRNGAWRKAGGNPIDWGPTHWFVPVE